MSDEKKYYCFCGSNCKYETMTKEQILAAIAEATGAAVTDVDAGFITKVKEKNGGGYVTFWVGTQAQYNALQTYDNNCVYIITDETTDADISKAIAAAEEHAQSTDNPHNVTAAQIGAMAKEDVVQTRKVYVDGFEECRVWSNGFVEWWKTYKRNETINLEMGSFFRGSKWTDEFPVTFAKIPFCTITVSQMGGDAAFVTANLVNVTESEFAYRFVSAEQLETASYVYHVYAAGYVEQEVT